MAQKKSASGAKGKKTTSSSRSTSASSRSAAARERRKNSRILNTLVFFALGVFTLLGYFTSDGAFIRLLRSLLSGLLGGGFYVLPPALIACAVIFAVSQERPKKLRIAAILCIPVVIGMFVQLFSGKFYDVSGEMFARLWEDGKALIGGGAVSGLIVCVLKPIFSAVGTWILTGCLFVLVVWGASGATISKASERVRERREIREKWREENAAEEEKLRAEIEKREQQNREKREAAYREKLNARAERARARAIDIPMDDEKKEPEEKPYKKAGKTSLFNPKANKMAPDELFSDNKDKQSESDIKNKADESTNQPEPISVTPQKPEEEKVPEDFGIESPFLTGKLNRAPSRSDEKPAPEEPKKREPEPAPVRKPEPVKAPEPVKTPEPAEKEEKEKSFEELIEESAKRDLSDALQVYKFPPIELLEAPKLSGRADASSELMATKERLELILQSFGVNATISNIINGPSVTRYEMELEIGVKLNKITSLSDDIALALGVGGVRISAIPNKISTVGIEVPNKNTYTVYLREIISSPEFTNAKSKLTFALGKNIGGEVMTGNINKLPHLLIAGTTGSGKSVSLNSLILSLMYKSTPEEVKFIMIDPKMVEFKIYNGIPHLLVPVVTEAKKAAGALQWAVVEMMKRYKLFSEVGARDIAGYNEHLKAEGEQPIPFIVVIIDELADLMLVAAKEVEESICRVAQMGRAAGVHLVIATQSPRADVITGLMKANIPSRISFKVASALESRIILDAGGSADKLMGNGDMLYAPIGTSKPIRIQGTWVSDEERESIVNFVKSSCEAKYSEDVIHEIEKAAEDKSAKGAPAQPEAKEKDYDDLIPQAVDVIFETQQASVSMLQRRLKLGYARAARLVDQMEEMGIVGPFEGSKPRQILITKQRWQEMQFINGTAPIEKPPEDDFTMTSADDLFEDTPPENYSE